MQERDYDVVLVQETRLLGQDMLEVKDKLRRAGWRSYWAEAYKSAKGKACVGVAILVRADLDAWQPTGAIQPVVAQHRMVSCMFRTRGLGVMVLYSCYLVDSIGLGGSNANLVEALGCHILGHGLPVVVGGDFQVRPTIFEQVVNPHLWGCSLVHDEVLPSYVAGEAAHTID